MEFQVGDIVTHNLYNVFARTKGYKFFPIFQVKYISYDKRGVAIYHLKVIGSTREITAPGEALNLATPAEKILYGKKD